MALLENFLKRETIHILHASLLLTQNSDVMAGAQATILDHEVYMLSLVKELDRRSLGSTKLFPELHTSKHFL